MIDIFRAGGFSMWIVLGFGLGAIAASFGLLRDPEPRRLAAVRAITWGGVFAVVAGVTANVIAVCSYLAREERDPRALYQGLAEALNPAVLGATLLSVAWLIVAVAVRRGPAA